MKRWLILLAAVLLLPAATTARADTFRMGGTFNAISIDFDGVAQDWYGTVGGGSYDISQLNGVNLPWVYCVDLEHTILLNTTYDYTVVRTDGVVNNVPVSNGGRVAWLLDSYADAVAGNNALEAALQAAIWEAIYGDRFNLLYNTTTAPYYSTAVSFMAASLNQTAPVSDYVWLSPGGTNLTQGLVSTVPEPGSLLLLGVGLFGLAWAARRRARKA